MTDESTASCNKTMCNLNIHTKKDTQTWFQNNHPDKGGLVVDSALFTQVKKCYDAKQVCVADDKNVPPESAPASSSAPASAAPANTTNPDINEYLFKINTAEAVATTTGAIMMGVKDALKICRDNPGPPACLIQTRRGGGTPDAGAELSTEITQYNPGLPLTGPGTVADKAVELTTAGVKEIITLATEIGGYAVRSAKKLIPTDLFNSNEPGILDTAMVTMKIQADKLYALTQNADYQMRVRELAKAEAVNIIQLSQVAQPVVDASVEVFFTMLSKITKSSVRGSISLAEDVILAEIGTVPGAVSVVEIVMAVMPLFGIIMGIISPMITGSIHMAQTASQGFGKLNKIRATMTQESAAIMAGTAAPVSPTTGGGTGTRPVKYIKHTYKNKKKNKNKNKNINININKKHTAVQKKIARITRRLSHTLKRHFNRRLAVAGAV